MPFVAAIYIVVTFFLNVFCINFNARFFLFLRVF